ncbi:MAG: peptidoglycan DD-metalloendopeptidase family protein [Clostridia bacterium]
MKKNNFKVILSIFAILFITCISTITANSTADKQKQFEELKRKEVENKKRQQNVESEITKDVELLNSLDKEVSKYNNELEDLQSKLNAVNGKIKTCENDLQNAAQRANNAEELYEMRLRAIYENGLPSVADILFTSEGISDFFSKMNVYNSILDYDKSLIESMKNQKQYTDNLKNDIAVQQVQLKQLSYDMEKSTQALESAKLNKKNKINELKKSNTKLKETGLRLKKEKDELNKKIQEEILEEQNKNKNNSDFNGQFYWPVTSFNVITTKFNQKYDPWDTGSFTIHTGCDVAGSGIKGTPIRAVESGKVIIAKRLTYGYGRYIVIDHGKSTVDNSNYTSLYGHMTDYTVNIGSTVQRGQVIGYVGSTGNSTGAHLHLEFRKNGLRVNPLSYFSGMKFIYR